MQSDPQIAKLLITRYRATPAETLGVVAAFPPLDVRWCARNEGDWVKKTPNAANAALQRV